MTATRPPAPTTPAVGPATLGAAIYLAGQAADILERTLAPELVDDVAATAPQRAEAARLLRTAAELVDGDVDEQLPCAGRDCTDDEDHGGICGVDAPKRGPVPLARPADAPTPLVPRERRGPSPLDLDPARRRTAGTR